jgi:hypothetical protein
LWPKWLARAYIHDTDGNHIAAETNAQMMMPREPLKIIKAVIGRLEMPTIDGFFTQQGDQSGVDVVSAPRPAPICRSVKFQFVMSIY